MGRDWRLADTGLRSAAQNIALDRALLEARRAEEIPTTLRFFRTTAAILLGHQDSPLHEVNPDVLAARSVPVQRRITGGSTYYTDPAQLGWSLYLNTSELADKDLRTAARHLCHAVATAVAAMGVDARVRRHDELEVGGRLIGGCGLAAEGSAVLFHGWLYARLDRDALAAALRWPAAYAPEHLRAGVGERFDDLGQVLLQRSDAHQLKSNIVEALESAFGVELAEGDLTLTEESRYRGALPEIDTTGWVEMHARPAVEAPQLEASHRSGAQTLRAALIVDTRAQCVKRIWLSAENAPQPRRLLLDLEAELRDTPYAAIARKLDWFFGSRAVSAELNASDVATVIARALRRPLLAENS